MRIPLIVLVLVLSGFSVYSQGYAVVGNDIGTSVLSRADLKAAFKPKNTFWPNRRTVIIILPGNTSSIRDVVAKDIYNSTFVAMQKYWLSLVFQGRFSAPVILNSDEEVINFVRKTPGAIGLVSDPETVPPSLLIRINP